MRCSPLPHSPTLSRKPRSPPTLLSHAPLPCPLAGNNEKKLAAHLKRCRAEGGLATADTLAVGQVKRRKLNEAE